MTDPFARLRRFLRELKRRNVYKVAVAYVAVSFVVLQGARLLVPALVLPEWFYRVVVALALLGFPLAVVLAWAFEVTPEGVRRTETPEAEGTGESGAYRWIGLAVVVLVAGGAWYATTRGGGEGASPAKGAAATDTARVESTLGERSIAVLPFEALGRQAPGAFTEGMHDALLTRLSNISGLKVISRQSVQQYRGSAKTTAEIARELGVKWVVEGGVQEMGDQIQVNAQLIDARTEAHAWANSYRRDLTAEDLFALQTEITKKIARSLEAELTPEEAERVERRPTGDLDAYQLYVQGRRRLDRRTGESIREAIDYFQQALRQDSSYALAWSGLADAAGLYPVYGSDSVPASLPEQEQAARRALQLDPDLAEAHASMGLVHLYQRNGPRSLRELRRALELKPSYAQAHDWLGLLLLEIGRPEQAQEHLELAVELNPENQNAPGWLVRALVANGRYEEALALARREGILPGEFLALLHLKRWSEARRLAREALDAATWPPATRWLKTNLALADIGAGDTASARRWLDELKRGHGSVSPVSMALTHAALGRHDSAIAVLARSFEEGSAGASGPVPYLDHHQLRYFYPDVLGPLREDSRFEELIREINRQWGLDPDGSLPDSVNVSLAPPADR